MSMRIVPEQPHSSTFSAVSKTASAPSAPGLHDTLRHGVGPSSSALSSSAGQPEQPASRHPLEARLKAWEATQENLRMESLRKTFGMAEPIRRGMELKIVQEGQWRPAMLQGGAGGSGRSVQEDILRGRDASCDWEDVYTGEEQRGAAAVGGMHDEMERKLRI